MVLWANFCCFYALGVQLHRTGSDHDILKMINLKVFQLLIVSLPQNCRYDSFIFLYIKLFVTYTPKKTQMKQDIIVCTRVKESYT